MQEIAWVISIWLMGLLATAFMFVALSTSNKKRTETNQGLAGKVRTTVFWLILITGVPVSILTLEHLPYSTTSNTNKQIVTVEGSQYNWDIYPEVIETNKPIEFHVSSEDVTHGFAIYDEAMTLIAQTQAMPEYSNILTYTFTKPGIYKILCLEYCGMGHHIMNTEITVEENGDI